MNLLKIRIEGTTPMLQRNGRLANELDPFTQRIGELTKAKKRRGVDKLDILRQLAVVELEGGMYFSKTPGVGPVIPAMMIKACICQGAKLTRGGKNVERCVNILEYETPLTYEGPREIAALIADANFRDQRMVKIGQAKVLRTRPKFPVGWALEFTLNYSNEGIEREDILRYIRDAGQFEGLGDHRGKGGFGRFVISHVDGKVYDEAAALAA